MLSQQPASIPLKIFSTIWSKAWEGNHEIIDQHILAIKDIHAKQKLVHIAMQQVLNFFQALLDEQVCYRDLKPGHIELKLIYCRLPNELRPQARALNDNINEVAYACFDKAFHNNDLERLNYFLQLYFFKDKLNEAHTIEKMSYFQMALKHGYINLAKLFKENGADVEKCHPATSTLMIEMAKSRNLPACQYLLEHCDYKINDANSEGTTPLIAAMQAINTQSEMPKALEFIEYLLTNGASPCKTNRKGESPLKRALRIPFFHDLHVLLLSFGAKLTSEEMKFDHNRKALNALYDRIKLATVQDRFTSSSKLTLAHRNPSNAKKASLNPLSLPQMLNARSAGMTLNMWREYHPKTLYTKRQAENTVMAKGNKRRKRS